MAKDSATILARQEAAHQPGSPDTPEAPSTLAAQLDLMREGKRTAVEVPHVAPGDLPSTLAPRQGEEAIATPDGGSLIYRTARLDAREARKVVRDAELRAQALGYGAYTPPELADRVVILRSRVGELMTARANAATEPQVVAALKAQASPGDVVLVRHGEQGRQYAEDLRTASRNSDAATAREAEGKGWQAKASIDPAELEALAARSGDFHLPSTADSHRAVTAPDGSKFWGRITPEMSEATQGRLKPLPIIVKAGSNLVDVQAGKGEVKHNGFGYLHLLRHGKDFLKNQLSPSRFLHMVLGAPDEVYKTDSGRVMLVKNLPKNKGAVIVQLHQTGDAYSATTAIVERPTYDWTKRNQLLWKRSEPASPVAQPSQLTLEAQQADVTRRTPSSQDGNAGGAKTLSGLAESGLTAADIHGSDAGKNRSESGLRLRAQTNHSSDGMKDRPIQAQKRIRGLHYHLSTITTDKTTSNLKIAMRAPLYFTMNPPEAPPMSEGLRLRLASWNGATKEEVMRQAHLNQLQNQAERPNVGIKEIDHEAIQRYFEEQKKQAIKVREPK